MRLRLPGLVLLLALPTVAAGAADPATNAGPVDFDRDVRPILAQHCYECHGPDKSKGGLRLDQATAIGRPGKSGKVAITAGHADQSELIRRVTTTDADDRMPPEKERL
ncbi:MAG: c-type cytochrome domain-containing protein, partial [Phycisphaerae bacterium]